MPSDPDPGNLPGSPRQGTVARPARTYSVWTTPWERPGEPVGIPEFSRRKAEFQGPVHPRGISIQGFIPRIDPAAKL